MRWLLLVLTLCCLGCQRTPAPDTSSATITKQDYLYDVIGPMFPGASGRCYDLMVGKPYADAETEPGVIRLLGAKERPCN